MPTATYKEGSLKIETRTVTGTADLSATLSSGTAVVDNSDGTVTLTTSDAHGFLAGSHLYIEGTTNYNGTQLLTAVTTSGITFKNDYTAETPDGTETAKFIVAPECDFVLLEVSLHLSAAAATVENFVCTLDANAGAAFDQNLITEDVNGHADLAWTMEKYCMDDDKLVFTLPNTDGRTYGLEVKYRRIR